MTTHGSSLRDQFLLDPSIIFLNHGSFGACPRPVFEEYQRWQRELERQPVEFLGRRFDDLLRAARQSLAQYVNCDADDLVYVPNATVGLNIVARSLALKPGDEILSTDHEYGALDRTWTFLSEKVGAVYKRLPIPVPVTTLEDFVETFWSGVNPRTRVIFISHISSPTALIFPIQEICRRARAAGILTIIDGAHAVGQIPLDLTALGADFYSSNCHKWLLSAKGSAFLYARRDVQSLVEPLVVSWGWHPEKPAASRFVQEQEWQGTRDIAAYLSVPAAIEFLRANHWDTVRNACHQLACYARDAITTLTRLEPLSSDTWFAQMVSVPLPPCNKESLKQRLYDQYKIEVPIIFWNDRHLIRISIQVYNTRADVDALAAALKEIFSL
ncbi:MAG TPA: aminotransferase class V-fold PLP-dependent enzyme [Anaerolineae bacterium]|nr:aminotransferase class V-fold PLP-dependent enzyme [Anaerolineae bacterium]